MVRRAMTGPTTATASESAAATSSDPITAACARTRRVYLARVRIDARGEGPHGPAEPGAAF